METTVLLLDLLIRLTAQASRIHLLLKQARVENRDLTSEELKSVMAEDDIARAALDEAIAAARKAESTPPAAEEAKPE